MWNHTYSVPKKEKKVKEKKEKKREREKEGRKAKINKGVNVVADYDFSSIGMSR